jgi:hypothetical protein
MSFTIKNPNSANAELGKRNETLYEPENNFIFDNTNSEKVIRGQNNTWIVLGRDRPSDRESGYGGIGAKKAGTIDIVAGRLSVENAKNLNTKVVNASFTADASRIYISQKTDIDKNFNISAGVSGNSVGNAGIGIKSDDIRIIARNTMKLVTGTDNSLSNGKPTFNKAGVQLIANNDSEDMQPIPKGINLELCFRELKDIVIELNGHLKEFIDIQTQFNAAVASHTHRDHFNAIQLVSPSGEILKQFPNALLRTNVLEWQKLTDHILSLTNWEAKYLAANSSDYINSTFHYLN